MAQSPTYTQEGEALKEIAEQIIDPIIIQYDGDVQDALTETRKKIRLNEATIREVAFVSLQEKGIRISKEFADRKTGDFYDDFKLFKNHFPEIAGRKAPIAGSLTGGNSPSAAEFKSGMSSFIKTHVNMSPEQLKAGKVPIGITGLDTPYREFNRAVSQNREQFFITSKGKRSNRKSADKTFLGYLTASLSKVVNEGKETGPDGNVILVETDDLTAGYRGQGREGKGFDKGLTAKSFVKMIQETISEIDKLPNVSDSDKANAKIYTLLNSYIPSRPKAFKDMMTSKPSKDSDFANRPYFDISDGKGYLMFPEGYGGGTKSYVSTELPNNITNIFLTLQNQKQGAGEAVPMLFDKNFTEPTLNTILSKTLGKVTAKPEYTTVLGKQAPAKSMSAFRKLTAGAMSRSLNLPDLSRYELHEFVLAHGVDKSGEAYTKQMHGQTQGSILNAFQHILASESGLDDLSNLNAHLGFDPVTVSSGVFEKVDPSTAPRTVTSIPQYQEPEIIKDVSPRLNLSNSDGKILAAEGLNALDRKLDSLQQIAPDLNLDDVYERDLSREFVASFKDSAEMMKWLEKNVDNFEGTLETNTGILEDLRDKAKDYAQRSLHKHTVATDTLDFLKGITKKVPKSAIAGPAVLGADVALEMLTSATPVAKASMPLPERPTVGQFVDQSIDRNLFQQEIADLPPRDEEGYLAELQDIISQRPLAERETDVDERSLFEGLRDKYIKPDPARIATGAVSQWRNIAETEPTYQEGEHRYTEEDYSSLEDERIRSIKDIENADLERQAKNYQDQMSALMGE